MSPNLYTSVGHGHSLNATNPHAVCTCDIFGNTYTHKGLSIHQFVHRHSYYWGRWGHLIFSKSWVFFKKRSQSGWFWSVLITSPCLILMSGYSHVVPLSVCLSSNLSNWTSSRSIAYSHWWLQLFSYFSPFFPQTQLPGHIWKTAALTTSKLHTQVDWPLSHQVQVLFF